MKNPSLSRVLVLDLELTCWEGPPPPGMHSEIIQIGVVELDTGDLTLTREGVFFINPVHSTVSPYCTELTGITPEQLRRFGRNGEDVFRSIYKKFGPSNKACFVWGRDGDTINESAFYLPDGKPFEAINLSLQFSILMGTQKKHGLLEALNLMGLGFNGRQHDALIDARNTARLLAEMMRKIRTVRSATPLFSA